MSVQDLVGLCFFEIWVALGPLRSCKGFAMGMLNWGQLLGFCLCTEAWSRTIFNLTTCKSRSFIIPIIHVERFSHVRNANKLNRKWRVFIIYWYQWRQKIYIYIYPPCSDAYEIKYIWTPKLPMHLIISIDNDFRSLSSHYHRPVTLEVFGYHQEVRNQIRAI